MFEGLLIKITIIIIIVVVMFERSRLKYRYIDVVVEILSRFSFYLITHTSNKKAKNPKLLV